MIEFTIIFLCAIVLAVWFIFVVEFDVSENIKRFTSIAVNVTISILIIVSSLLTYTLIRGYQGTPIEIESVEKYLEISGKAIVYGQVISYEEEKIYMLILKPNEKFPPVYVVTDYNEELHEALAEGNMKFEGSPFTLELGDGSMGRNGEGDGEENGEISNLSLESEPFKVSGLPQPVLPKKD